MQSADLLYVFPLHQPLSTQVASCGNKFLYLMFIMTTASIIHKIHLVFSVDRKFVVQEGSSIGSCTALPKIVPRGVVNMACAYSWYAI